MTGLIHVCSRRKGTKVEIESPDIFIVIDRLVRMSLTYL